MHVLLDTGTVFGTSVSLVWTDVSDGGGLAGEKRTRHRDVAFEEFQSNRNWIRRKHVPVWDKVAVVASTTAVVASTTAVVVSTTAVVGVSVFDEGRVLIVSAAWVQTIFVLSYT